MVREFTEEERRRQRESTERHYERHHSGELAGTPCNSYADCTKIDNDEWVERLRGDANA